MGGGDLPGARVLRPSRAGRVPAPAPASDLADCPLGCLAAVLSGLLGREVLPAPVLERAVALGLLRYPTPGESVLLSPQTAARLFLAGYRLPVHVGAGSLAALAGHVRARRRVLVLLADGPDHLPQGAVTLWQVIESGPDAAVPGLTLRLACQANVLRHLPLDDFQRSWRKTGRLLIVAANAWADLPGRGRLFFGGGRDPDGTYHWDTAECVTDGAGHVLR
jgi:hypothetical protein